jgi:hypothetical protein
MALSLRQLSLLLIAIVSGSWDEVREAAGWLTAAAEATFVSN